MTWVKAAELQRRSEATKEYLNQYQRERRRQQKERGSQAKSVEKRRRPSKKRDSPAVVVEEDEAMKAARAEHSRRLLYEPGYWESLRNSIFALEYQRHLEENKKRKEKKQARKREQR